MLVSPAIGQVMSYFLGFKYDTSRDVRPAATVSQVGRGKTDKAGRISIFR